jgi:hypothetical protein
MIASYVKETDEQLRQASNRTFCRILARLPLALARRCGHVDQSSDDAERRLQRAINAKDWALASRLTACMARCQAKVRAGEMVNDEEMSLTPSTVPAL